jgi:spore germination cell wall hydrolase CwlJ-like protein
MTAVQNYINKHHDFIIKVGGLFMFTFLMVYVPMDLQVRAQRELLAHMASEQSLTTQVNELNNQVGYYKEAYNKRKFTESEVTCLAQNIYYEAGAEPVEGKIAVAEVTMNRKKHPDYPKTVCGVVKQKSKGSCQFSWVCSPAKPVRNKASWRDSVKIAENILISRKKYGIIGDAKFFHASYVDPYWADSKEFKTRIGNHLFYR